MRNPPPGTAQRIRSRTIWAVALFAAAVPPAFVSTGVGLGEAYARIALPIALSIWALGMAFALSAAFPTLRYWEHLPGGVRWLGALPLLSVVLFTVAALASALAV
jgi:hypothetical protein